MGWDKKLLDGLRGAAGLISAGDERMERYCEDTMMRGSPDAVLVARDEQEVSEILEYCNGNRIPVTFCGSQTSMTGSSVPLEGLLISTERLEGILDISSREGRAVASVRCGTVVADLQKAVADAGFFYPVAPTSRDECRIGGNVATNATGEDSFKYGPVRNYVERLGLVMPNGSSRTLERSSDEQRSWDHNRAGYFTGWKNPIDLVIGSEGTLAFVSTVSLSLLPSSPSFFSALIPLPSNARALEFVMAIATGKTGLTPRTLELIDTGALSLMKGADGFPEIPDSIAALLYIKEEFRDGQERDRMLELWFEKSRPFSGSDLVDRILIALTRDEQEDFRLWRHRIPEAANELGRANWPNGGGKVGSDWWVPIDKLPEMMSFFYDAAKKTCLPYMGYAHIGSGHPHTNILAKDATEKQKALDVLRACCRKAASLGGGVAGEHGIGKIHRDLLSIQHSAEIIERMKQWKTEYDPNWILGRGTIFDE